MLRRQHKGQATYNIIVGSQDEEHLDQFIYYSDNIFPKNWVQVSTNAGEKCIVSDGEGVKQ